MSNDQPDPQAVADFNASVQKLIDDNAAEGKTISWDDAVKQAQNFFKNWATDPEGTQRFFDGLAISPVDLEARVTATENTAVDHEGRLQVIERALGGAIVGPGNG